MEGLCTHMDENGKCTYEYYYDSYGLKVSYILVSLLFYQLPNFNINHCRMIMKLQPFDIIWSFCERQSMNIPRYI